MKYVLVKAIGSLVLALMLLSLVMQVTLVQSVTSDAPEKTMQILKDVLQIDIEKYETELTRYNTRTPDPYSSILPDGMPDTTVTYTIKNDGNVGTAYGMFKNNILTSCRFSIPNAQVIYAQPIENYAKAAQGILERYQEFLGDSSLTDMIEATETVKIDAIKAADTLNDTILTAIDMKLEIKAAEHRTSFLWMHTFNGVDYKEVLVSFEPSRINLYEYGSRYKIGSTEVAVSEQQAIDIALSYIENDYSYNAVGGTEENRTVVKVSDFIVDMDRIETRISASERADGLLYPNWKVTVGLGKGYPGNVYAISIFIQADSGEIFDCAAEAVGGYIENEPSPIATPSASPSTSSTPEPSASVSPPFEPSASPSAEPSTENRHSTLNITIITIASIVAVLVSSGAAVLFKKRNK
jgi:hypothetical protein